MRSKTILIAEDEGIVARDIQATLERLGYSITGAVASGEEAIDMAHYNHPDLVLMDIVLKGPIDGIEAARHIRDELDIPVIYLTAFADEETVERAKLTEPFGYVIKPFEERELHTMVEIALHKHRLERQLQEREQWLAAVLRSIGDGVIATDDLGRIRFMNTIAEELTGWPQARAAGRPLEEPFMIWDEITGEKVDAPTEALLVHLRRTLCAMRLRAVPHSEGGERGAEGDFSVRYPLFALRLPSRRLGGNALLVWIAHPLLRSCTRAA